MSESKETGDEMMGFTIRCGANGDEVVVSDEEAQAMAAECVYFKHVFAHGTKEAAECILIKPDWSKDTAEQLVQLLTKGKAFLPG